MNVKGKRWTIEEETKSYGQLVRSATLTANIARDEGEGGTGTGSRLVARLVVFVNFIISQ